MSLAMLLLVLYSTFCLHVTIFSTVVDPSPTTNVNLEYWYSRLPEIKIPKSLEPGQYYPHVNRNFSFSLNEKGTVVINGQQKYGKWYNVNRTIVPLPRTTIYYLYNDGLQPGKKMRLLFNNGGSEVGFLASKDAQSIPFSSGKLGEILHHLGIDSNSREAKIMREEILECESPSMEGEEKFCATSLNSLINFNVQKLGEDLLVVSTDEGKEEEYTVLEKVKMMGEKAVICHKIKYPYAVYYCHMIKDTEVYTVPLVSIADGTKLKAVTVCHLNTTAWSPQHLAFRILQSKPGAGVCHFLFSDTLVWLPRKA